MHKKIKKISTCKCGAVVAKELDVCPFCNKEIKQSKNTVKKDKNDEAKISKRIKNIYKAITKIIPSGVIHFVFAFAVIILVGYSAFAITDFVATKEFNATKSLLASERMETTVLPSIPEGEEFSLAPNATAIYQSRNLYVFHLFTEHTIKNENGDEVMCDYRVAAYLQKPTNVVGYYCKDWYGELLTDKYFISVALQENGEQKRKIDLLKLNKTDQLHRLNNIAMNDISFEVYQAKSDDTTTYFLVSDGIRGVHLIYTIALNSTEDIPNFNYLVNASFSIDNCQH